MFARSKNSLCQSSRWVRQLLRTSPVGALIAVMALQSAWAASAPDPTANDKGKPVASAVQQKQKHASPVRSVSNERVPASVARALPSDTIESLTLAVGQAHLLEVGEIRRVAVGNGRILQVNALDQRQLLLLPENPGESTLHLWLAKGGIKRYRIQVTALDGKRLADEINQLLGPGNGVVARAVGDKVVLEGSRPTEEGSHRVGEILKRYPEVISLVSRHGFEQMIDLEVKMIEISRNALKQLGVRWHSGAGSWAMAGPSFGVLGDFKRSDAFLPGGAAAATATGHGLAQRVSPFATAASWASSMASIIETMVQNGEAAILAEPRLSARSGGTAKFVAGGELPLPVLGGNGAASVQFKEYGVRFDVSPVVNELGIISASLHTEISSIDADVTVREMPGLRKQSATTDVNLRAGETLVIAGMLSHEMSGSVEKIPGLGDLPIIGHLFKSRRFRNRESEMIVLITPRLADSDASGPDPRAESMLQRHQTMKGRFGMLE
ncbi:MAG: pilus assembly protein N-terminal domain-containing protein [Lautropia sp.]|nr:pilus assembly protein N-terminal domain-containing protein [Lautropia sp.]